jgi:hypothetical protein
MKLRGACSGRHLEGYRRYPVPFGCIVTIPEVRCISVWIIPQAGLRLVSCHLGAPRPAEEAPGRHFPTLPVMTQYGPGENEQLPAPGKGGLYNTC